MRYRYLQRERKLSRLLALSLAPRTARGPRKKKYPQFEEIRVREMEESRCLFHSAEGSPLTAALSLLFLVVVSCPRCDRQPE